MLRLRAPSWKHWLLAQNLQQNFPCAGTTKKPVRKASLLRRKPRGLGKGGGDLCNRRGGGRLRRPGDCRRILVLPFVGPIQLSTQAEGALHYRGNPVGNLRRTTRLPHGSDWRPPGGRRNIPPLVWPTPASDADTFLPLAPMPQIP